MVSKAAAACAEAASQKMPCYWLKPCAAVGLRATRTVSQIPVRVADYSLATGDGLYRLTAPGVPSSHTRSWSSRSQRTAITVFDDARHQLHRLHSRVKGIGMWPIDKPP
jgi:hypothetical protein